MALWLVVAFPITMVVFALLLILGLFLFLAEADVDAGEWLGHVMMFVLVFLIVAAGSWVLWLLTLGQGQTPGKAALGIRAVDVATGETVSWGSMFLREFAAKGFVWWVGLLATIFIDSGSVVTWLRIALMALWIVCVLWPLWDKNNQTLHDKVVGTTIVREKDDTPSSMRLLKRR